MRNLGYFWSDIHLFDIKTGAGSLARRDFVLLSSRVQDSQGESSGKQDLNISKITWLTNPERQEQQTVLRFMIVEQFWRDLDRKIGGTTELRRKIERESGIWAEPLSCGTSATGRLKFCLDSALKKNIQLTVWQSENQAINYFGTLWVNLKCVNESVLRKIARTN